MTDDDIRIRIQTGTFTQDDAIAFVNERLAEMFEEMNGVKPVIPANQPPHFTLVSWVPTLADYGTFVQQAGRAAFRARAEEDKVRVAQERAARAEAQASAAAMPAQVLKNIQKVLKEALARLSEVHPVGQGLYRCTKCKATEPFGGNAVTNGAHDCGGRWKAFDFEVYDKDFGDDEDCKCGHPYYRHFDTYEKMEHVGCKYCDCFTWQPPLESQAPPHHDPQEENPPTSDE